MIAYQGEPYKSTIRILDGSSSPILGLTHTDMLLIFKRSNENSFFPKTLNEENFVENGEGYYTIFWDSSDVSQVGQLVFKVSAIGVLSYYDFDILKAPISTLISADNCLISGSIVDFGGTPAVGTRITISSVGAPVIAQDVFVNSHYMETFADALGSFSFLLIQGVKVRVRIPSGGLDFQITVPNQDTAFLKDLIAIP